MEKLQISPQGKLSSRNPVVPQEPSKRRIIITSLLTMLFVPLINLFSAYLSNLAFVLTAFNRYFTRKIDKAPPKPVVPQAHTSRFMKIQIDCKNCGRPSFIFADLIMMKMKGNKNVNDLLEKFPCPFCHWKNVDNKHTS